MIVYLFFCFVIYAECLLSSSGLSDPAALPQAVSAFQACHFIGMPECEVMTHVGQLMLL